MEPIDRFRLIFFNYMITLGDILGMPIMEEKFHVQPMGYAMISTILLYILFSVYTILCFDINLSFQCISCMGMAFQVSFL